jgi:hypothetical protein
MKSIQAVQLCFAAMGLAIGLSALAASKAVPVLRARIEPHNEMLVGQPVTLEVDVLLPKSLAASVEWPKLPIPDTVAIVIQGDPMTLAEGINGVAYQGWRRHYLIRPLKAGRFEVGRAQVVVNSARKPLALDLPALEFTARLPAGAADHGYFLPAYRVTLEQSFDRSPAGLETGGALTRTITLIAEGTPVQLLPILRPAPVDGASVSSHPPVSSSLSGPIFGSRGLQTGTYVFRHAGNYNLPAVRIYWWDLSVQRMREAVLPEQPVTVVQNAAEKHETWRQELIIGAFLLFVLVAFGEFIYFGLTRRSKFHRRWRIAGKD